MSRFMGVAAAVLVVVLATAFAALNVGHRATLSLGLFTLYRVPVTLVAFSGLLVGMLTMFATGVHSDLKVRRILRDRLAEETRKEQGWIDRNQRDLFAQEPEAGLESAPLPSRQPEAPPVLNEVSNPPLAPLPLPPLSDNVSRERDPAGRTDAASREVPSSEGPEEEPKTE